MRPACCSRALFRAQGSRAEVNSSLPGPPPTPSRELCGPTRLNIPVEHLTLRAADRCCHCAVARVSRPRTRLRAPLPNAPFHLRQLISKNPFGLGPQAGGRSRRRPRNKRCIRTFHDQAEVSFQNARALARNPVYISSAWNHADSPENPPASGTLKFSA